jgi:hypothetical protein
MPASLRFIPETTIRWRARRFVIVDYAGLDALVAREIGKRRFHRVPLNEALVDLTPGDGNAWTPDLVSNRTISAVGTITAYGSPFCSTATRRVRRTCGRTNRTGNCFWEWHRRGVTSPNTTVRHDDVSIRSRWRQAARSVITGRRRCQTEAIEM